MHGKKSSLKGGHLSGGKQLSPELPKPTFGPVRELVKTKQRPSFAPIKELMLKRQRAEASEAYATKTKAPLPSEPRVTIASTPEVITLMYDPHKPMKHEPELPVGMKRWLREDPQAQCFMTSLSTGPPWSKVVIRFTFCRGTGKLIWIESRRGKRPPHPWNGLGWRLSRWHAMGLVLLVF